MIRGDMFPAAELDGLGDRSPQIPAGTAIEWLVGAMCEWRSPEAGDLVFLAHATAPLEQGVRQAALLT